jgi:hypothetical protein
MLKVNPRRTQHYMRPNHGTHVPRNLIFVDTIPQSIPVEHQADVSLLRLDFGVADAIRFAEGEESRWVRQPFKTPLAFWSFVNRRIRTKTSTWLIGHGIAKHFTLVDGWRHLDSGYYSLMPREKDTISQRKDEHDDLSQPGGFLIDGDPPTLMILYAPDHVVHVVDIQNYGVATVEELAAAAGVKLHQKPDIHAPYKMWEAYLSKRVLAVRQYFVQLLAFWETRELGQFRHTAASLALAAYRHKFLRDKILIHTCEPALHAEREALVGGQFTSYFCGRIEPAAYFDAKAKKTGNRKRGTERQGPVYVFDCNSLYPYVMRNHDFPAELVAPKSQGEFEDLLQWRKQLALIARVEVETVQHPYPLVHDRERYWAVGRFWTVLAGPELDRAIDYGHVRRVGEIYAYTKANLFQSYVDYFHEQRLAYARENKVASARFCKLLLNSLAGKFGQRDTQWDFTRKHDCPKRWGSWHEIHAQTGVVETFRAIAGDVQIQTLGRESMQSAPAIEAYINAYAREYMRTVRRVCPPRSVLYQGCDSLHVLEAGRAALAPYLETYPGELGKFKLEKVAERAEYFGPQDYSLDGVATRAGLSPDAIPDGAGGYRQTEEQRLRSILTHEPGGFLRVKQITVTRAGYHPKGYLESDGSVSPYVMWQGRLYFLRPEESPIPFDADGIGK